MDGRSLVGDELVRRRVRVRYVQWLRSSRGRKERMGRWPGSRWLRRSGRRGRGRTAVVVTAEGISDGERRRRGRSRGLGARPARRRRQRRSCWTRSGDAETAVATATSARWQRLRRPWWRKARERRWGRKGMSRGSGARRGGRLARPRAKRQAGGAVASSRTPASPLCLLWREEATDWRGPAQCWAGQWAAR